jgi:DGQHR domain-containing protein
MPTLPAQRVNYNGYTFFAVVMDGKELLEASFVRRRQEQPRRGFQRVLNVARAREIARYLDNDHLTIPTNVVVSAQAVADLSYRNGHLNWSGEPKSFLVLDGQHRLAAMDYTDEPYDLLVAVYDDLTPQQEVRLFVDINTKQKGVPPALLLDIKQLAGTESDEESQLRELFDFLASERGSPLKGLLNPSGGGRGQVSRVTFNSAVKPLLTGRYLGPSNLTKTHRKNLLLNYIIASDRTLRASGATRNGLTTATVLHAFLELFDEIVQMTLERANSARADDLTATMMPLVDLDFDSHTGSNRPARARLASEMRGLLAPDLSFTDDML